MTDFSLDQPGVFSDLLKENGCFTFAEASEWMKALPCERTSDREDLTLVFSEKCGTASSKHAVLAYVALEQHHPEVEIVAGIFMMSADTHPELAGFFSGKPYSSLPECHCYLRINGNRFDFTSPKFSMERISPKIVREQRMDPHQSIEWKVNIHRNYIESWLKRNPQIFLSPEAIWDDRETCMRLLSSAV